MFVPLYAAKNHFRGDEYYAVPKITTAEKVVLVISAFTFFAGMVSTAALFMVPFPHFTLVGVLMAAFLTVPATAWVVTTDTLSYRSIETKGVEDESESESASSSEGEYAAPLVRAAVRPTTQREIPRYEDEASRQLLGRLPRWLTYEEEFLRVRGQSLPEPKEDKLGNAAREQLSHFCHSKVGTCGSGYQQRALKAALKNLFSDDAVAKQQALLFTLPFLIAVYKERGDERTDVHATLIPFLREQFTDMDARIFDALERCLNVVAPLSNLLSAQDFEGKPFLFDAVHQFIFHIIPAVLSSDLEDDTEKRATKAKHQAIQAFRAMVHDSSAPIADEFRYAFEGYDARQAALAEKKRARAQFNDVLKRVTLPQLSQMVAGEMDVGAYLGALERGDEAQPLLRRPQYVDLLPFATTIDHIFAEMEQRLTDTSAHFESQAANRKEYQALVASMKGIFGALLGHFKTYFGDDATPGEMVVKSYLIGHEMWNVFPTDDARVGHTMQWLQCVQQAVAQADIDVPKVDPTPILHKVFGHLEGDTAEAVKLAPFHDAIPLLLTCFFAASHLHKARPFIRKNLPTLFLMFDDFEQVVTTLFPDPQLQRYFRKYKGMVKTQVGLFLALSKPFNGILTGKMPGKSALLKKAMRSGMRRVLKGQKDPHFIQAIQSVLPLAQFLILGIFGSKDKERSALADLSTDLERLYRGLYDFDMEEMAAHPHRLQAHIRQTLAPLSEGDAGAGA